MYFMLCGHVLFPDRTTRSQKIDAQRNIEPQPIRNLVPDVPDEVAAIVQRMLAKDPGQRFAAAHDLVAELEPFAKSKHVTFDFQQILSRRFAIARQRQKLLDKHAQRAAAASSLSVCSVDSKAGRPLQAQLETTIQKDTHVGAKGERQAEHEDQPPRLCLPDDSET